MDAITFAAGAWEAAAVLRRSPSGHHIDWIRDGNAPPITWASQDPVTPAPGPATALPTSTPIVLIDAFAGSSFARVAVDDVLTHLGARSSLVYSGFIESNDRYAEAVQALWDVRQTQRGVVPHPRLASDIWDVFRPDGPDGTSPLVRLLSDYTRVPKKALFLIVGGPPCQQLSVRHAYKGWWGLHGPDSVHFFALPILAWFAQQLRPDLTVHVLVENVHTMIN